MMISIRSLLAVDAETVVKFGIIALAVILLGALFVGFKRGVKQVGWKALAGFATAELFYTVHKLIGDKFMLQLPENPYVDGIGVFKILLALACVGVVLLVYGLLSRFFRPRYKWVIKNPVYRKGAYEYEDDSAEYATGETQRRLVWKNAGIPTIYGRFLGGIVCILNVAAILFFVLTLAMLGIKNSKLGSSELFVAVFADAKVNLLYKYINTVGLDFIFVSIIFAIACTGYKYGFFKSMFVFFKSFGTVLGIGLGFAIPFTLIKTPIVVQCIEMVRTPLAALIEGNAMIANFISPTIISAVSQAVVGIVLSVALVLVFKLLTELFRALAKKIKRNEQTLLNGIFGCVLFVLLGVLVCVLLCAVFGVLKINGLLNIDFIQDSTLGKIFIDLVAKFIKL